MKTYDISFWNAGHLIGTVRVEGTSKKQVKKLGDEIAVDLRHSLNRYYEELTLKGPRKVRVVVNLKK